MRRPIMTKPAAGTSVTPMPAGPGARALCFGVRPAPTRQGATLPVSLALHALAVAALVLVPLLSREPRQEESPEPPRTRVILPVGPARPDAAQPPAIAPAVTRRPGSSRPAPAPQLALRPAVMPPTVIALDAETSHDLVDPVDAIDPHCPFGCGPPSGDGTSDGPPGDAASGGPASNGGSRGGGRGPGEPLRISSGFSAPRKLVHVAPDYPPIARATRIQGAVRIDCVIDPAGRVGDVRVLSGHPLLAPAAADAVREWRYEPTRLNGIPVSVVLTVTVEFRIP
jgi:protein TonB